MGSRRGNEEESKASRGQGAAREADRTRAWELYVRGWSRVAIARELVRDRETVSRWIAAGAAELEREGRVKRAREVGMAVARLRAVQQQAWADHDADDERERGVLERGVQGGGPGTRYQSQRAHYLRVVLDTEREIARLRGLYDEGVALEGAVVFRLERVSQGAPVPAEREEREREERASLSWRTVDGDGEADDDA